jgi:hypothetical protein
MSFDVTPENGPVSAGHIAASEGTLVSAPRPALGNPPAAPPQQPRITQPLGYGPLPAPRASKAKIVWSIIGVLVVIGAIANSMNPSPSPSGARRSDAAAEAPDQGSAPVSTVYRIGQPVAVGSVTFTVLSVRTIPPSEYFQPEPGSQFVGVNIEAFNNGTETETVSSLAQFSIRDRNGQRYDQTITDAAAASLDGSVPPGSRLRGEIAYEVPAGAFGLQLIITDFFAEAVTVQLT